MAGSPAWSRPGDQMMSILWKRVLEQARQADVKVPRELLSEEPPKEFAKMAYFTEVLKALVEEDPSKHMKKRKSSKEYVEKVLAGKLGWKKTSAVSEEKQSALFSIPTNPTWTKVTQSFPIERQDAEFDRVRLLMRQSPDWKESNFRDEMTAEPWTNEVHNLPNSLFICGHAHTVAGSQIMPWSSKRGGEIETLPMPERYYAHGAEVLRKKLMLQGTYLKPAHLLVGSASSGGKCINGEGVVVISNSAGAPGMPYPKIKDARKLTTDGNRATKANVAKVELEAIVDWIKAGQPWTGPAYERLAQPNTMWRRGDAKVRVVLAAFCKALLLKGFPLASLLLPGRGIVIVSTAQTLLELVAFKPYQENLSDKDVQNIDLRTRRFTKTVIRGILSKVLEGQGARAVGADVARWDLNAYPGEHGIMAAFMMSLFEKGDHEILVGCASRPALWPEDLIRDLKRDMRVGEERYVSVEVPNVSNEGTHVERVKVEKLAVNIRKMIAQVYQMVHGSGVHMAGYDLPVKKFKVRVPGSISSQNDVEGTEQDYVIFVHGAIRSGSGGTSANNSNLNCIVVKGSSKALGELNPSKGLVAARGQHFALPQISEVTQDADRDEEIYRGDDTVQMTYTKMKDADGKDLGAEYVIAYRYALAGRYGNADKQRTGDYGVPEIEYASEMYDATFPGGITSIARTKNRSATSEASTSPAEVQPILRHERDKEAYNLGLITDTMTIKSRLAPQRGSTRPTAPQGSPTPGNEHFIKLIADFDKYGLTYGIEGKSAAEIAKYTQSEGIRWARREARKHNLDDEVIDELVSEWEDSDLHALLHSLQEHRTVIKDRSKAAANDSFEAMVASLMSE